jgi:hypothetical protein
LDPLRGRQSPSIQPTYCRPSAAAYAGAMPFTVLHVPEPRLLRPLNWTDSAFHADIVFAFAPIPPMLIRLADRGLTIVQTKGVEVRDLDDDPQFRSAVICLLRREVRRPEPEGLPPPGVKKRERDRRG